MTADDLLDEIMRDASLEPWSANPQDYNPPVTDDATDDDIQVRAISTVDIVGWFPNNERQVWIEISVRDQKVIRRLVLPN